MGGVRSRPNHACSNERTNDDPLLLPPDTEPGQSRAVPRRNRATLNEIEPVDTAKGQQHTAEFRAINPNGKVPAIIDTDGPGGAETRVFDSTAIPLYLGEKTGKLIGSPADRGELLSWLFFIATGLGPFSGQAVHFGPN
jgi:glutathione S-transferase